MMFENLRQRVTTTARSLASPPWFLDKARPVQLLLGWIGLSLFVLGSLWGLGFAPEDYQQGGSFRIIYIHVPASFLAQSCYLLMGAAALAVLVWRVKLADICIRCAAPLGAGFTLVSLTSGAIWGKPTWGAWWVSDARTLSMVILLFLYLGVMALRRALGRQAFAARASAMLVVVGLVNLPVIKYSVDWWLTLHQPASFSLTEAPAMPAVMWLPLLVNVVALYSLFGCFLLMAMRVELDMRQLDAHRLR